MNVTDAHRKRAEMVSDAASNGRLQEDDRDGTGGVQERHRRGTGGNARGRIRGRPREDHRRTTGGRIDGSWTPKPVFERPCAINMAEFRRGEFSVFRFSWPIKRGDSKTECQDNLDGAKTLRALQNL